MDYKSQKRIEIYANTEEKIRLATSYFTKYKSYIFHLTSEIKSQSTNILVHFNDFHINHFTLL